MQVEEGDFSRSLKNRAEQALKTLGIILKSRSVKEYAIGLAKSPCRSRAAAYRQWWKEYGDVHFVILIDGLSSQEALDSESYIHQCCRSKDRRSVYGKKRCGDKDKVVRRSLGGRTPIDGDSYSIYLAFRTLTE